MDCGRVMLTSAEINGRLVLPIYPADFVKKCYGGVYEMTKFNIKLAPYLEDDMVAKIAKESRKPVSLRSIARKFHLSVYAVKRLIDYSKSKERTNMVNQ